MLKGLRQPVLGHFSIDLGTFIKDTRERVKRKLRKFTKELAEKNEVFSQISDLIKKTDTKPQKKSISPSKDPNITIELSSGPDQGLKEPLIKQSSKKNEDDNKNGYQKIQSNQNEPLFLDLEVEYKKIYYYQKLG